MDAINEKSASERVHQTIVDKIIIVIFIIIYYAFFTPIGLVLKVLGKDLMNRKLKSGEAVSYWCSSKKRSNRQMRNMY